MKKLFYLFFYFLFFFIFVSCTSEINITVNKNGSVSAEFNGTAGKAMMSLMNSTSGNSLEEKDKIIFNIEEIKQSLKNSGFSDVKVSSKNGLDLYIKFTDTQKKSEYFTSGLLTLNNGKMQINLSQKNLEKFYQTTDEETVMYLDLFLSPVFNNDKMSESEYLEMIASVYGKEVSEEIKNCTIKLNIINTDSKKSQHSIKLTKLLTLNESFLLE